MKIKSSRNIFDIRRNASISLKNKYIEELTGIICDNYTKMIDSISSSFYFNSSILDVQDCYHSAIVKFLNYLKSKSEPECSTGLMIYSTEQKFRYIYKCLKDLTVKCYIANYNILKRRLKLIHGNHSKLLPMKQDYIYDTEVRITLENMPQDEQIVIKGIILGLTIKELKSLTGINNYSYYNIKNKIESIHLGDNNE